MLECRKNYLNLNEEEKMACTKKMIAEMKEKESKMTLEEKKLIKRKQTDTYFKGGKSYFDTYFRTESDLRSIREFSESIDYDLNIAIFFTRIENTYTLVKDGKEIPNDEKLDKIKENIQLSIINITRIILNKNINEKEKTDFLKLLSNLKKDTNEAIKYIQNNPTIIKVFLNIDDEMLSEYNHIVTVCLKELTKIENKAKELWSIKN